MQTNRQKDESKLWDAYRADPCDANRHALIMHYDGFVKSIALKSFNSKNHYLLSIDDYIAAGYVALIRCIDNYKAERGNLTHYAYISIWGYMLNEIDTMRFFPRAMRTKKTGKSKMLNMPDMAAMADLHHSTNRDLEQLEIADTVNHSLQALTEKELKIIKLYYFQNKSAKEIGRLCGFSRINAYWILSQSRRKLKTAMGGIK